MALESNANQGTRSALRNDDHSRPANDESNFWSVLLELERRQRAARVRHDGAHRRLDVNRDVALDQQRQLWRDYCEAAAELAESTIQIELHRSSRVPDIG